MLKIRSFDVAFWLLLAIGIIFFALFIIAVLDPSFIDETVGQSLKNKGEDYNFLIGVPLAAIGSFVAALIAAASNNISRAQYDVQANEIAERKLTEGMPAYKAILNNIDDCFSLGREVRNALSDAFDELAPFYPEDFAASALTLPDKVTRAAQGTLLHGTPMPDGFTEQERVEYRIALRLLHLRATITQTMRGIVDNLQFLTLDPFWSTALQRAQENGHAASWARPLLRLLEEEGATFNSRDGQPSARRIARILSGSTNSTTMKDFMRAPLYVPGRQIENFLQMSCYDFELFGAVLQLHDSATGLAAEYRAEVLEREDLTTEQKAALEEKSPLLNYGAANLICLVNALPDEEAIRHALKEMFPEISNARHSALNVLFRQLPAKNELCSDELLVIVDYFNANPEGLIYHVWSEVESQATYVEFGASLPEGESTTTSIGTTASYGGTSHRRRILAGRRRASVTPRLHAAETVAPATRKAGTGAMKEAEAAARRIPMQGTSTQKLHALPARKNKGTGRPSLTRPNARR